jgi:glutaredoxin
VDAKAYLDQAGLHYEEINVLADPEAYREMIRLSGQSYTPTLVVGDWVLGDFGADELADFLQTHNIKAS